MTARPRRRTGYTLLELTLVASVFTILAALVVPSLPSLYGSYKMNAATDAVRSAWAQARAKAIAEGRPYRFAVVPNEGLYRVAPDEPEFWGGDEGDRPGVVRNTLPKGVRFSVSDSGAMATNDGQDTESIKTAPLGSYASPIVFLPDGTAREDAEIVFQVRGARTTAVRLRALTGAVTVVPVGTGGGR